MKCVILSYLPGMFGEFTADLLQTSSEKFYLESNSTTNQLNRVLFPNYLRTIGLMVKTFARNQSWPVTTDQIGVLENIYKDKWICIPTHWYADKIALSNLPNIGIRLYCSDEKDLNLAYSMAWIKSHMVPQKLWKERRKEIEEMIKVKPQFTEDLQKLIDAPNYQNWKFLSYQLNILKNGKPDLELYIRQRHSLYKNWNISDSHSTNDWFACDIGKLISGDKLSLTQVETYLDIKLDTSKLESYKNRNAEVLYNTLKLSYNDLIGDSWLTSLVSYCKDVNLN
jgi:hypothetical protein